MSDVNSDALDPELKETYGEFEWILEPGDIIHLLSPAALGLEEEAKVLVTGCGTSALSELMYVQGFRHITSNDNNEAVILEMQNRNQSRPEMLWEMHDLTKPFAQVDFFDVAVDKGTMDALWGSSDDIIDMLCEIHRALVHGGVLFIVSFLPESFLVPFFSVPGIGFSIEFATLEGRSGVSRSICTLRKAGEHAPRDMIRQSQKPVWDIQFQQDRPFLTAARREALSEAFTAEKPEDSEAVSRTENGTKAGTNECSASDYKVLPLEDAFTSIFDRTEREEYTLEYFHEDLRATMPGALERGHMSLPEAILFLEANQ
jgi:SAM-dependent methyltransferase